MASRRLLLGATIASLLVGLLGIFLYGQQRAARCMAVPLLAPELLPNADLSQPGEQSLPAGWVGSTATISLTNFTVLPGGRSLQLLGIASYLQTPPVTPVTPDRGYCFTALALTDSPQASATRLQVAFQWLDATQQLVREDRSLWQPVALWQPNNPAPWSNIAAAATAPLGATALRVRLHPSSDDRLYLDQMHLRAGGQELQIASTANLQSANQQSLARGTKAAIKVLPWPSGRRAALSFSFDWETAMGGLVHSRSLDDPNAGQDHVARGLRMREGITTTLRIFQPHGIRATYYANGYNFLLGNRERRTFMGNPTFAWANTQPGHRWLSERWVNTPWFADDPYGTLASDPAWYFGDLLAPLRAAGHDIQSHTFSHLYGGFASPTEWQLDLTAWNQLAAEQGVAPARSLAFPWSGSGGMSDAAWSALEQAGIRSVTRLSDQAPYALVRTSEPHCTPVPGHETILACPDFYLTPESAAQAQALIDATIAVSGTLDLWAHTEEVVSPQQIAAWQQVVGYAAAQPELWIAPLAEISDWQTALAELSIENVELRNDAAATEPTLSFTATNNSDIALNQLALELPFNAQQYSIDGQSFNARYAILTLNLEPGQTVEIVAWR